MNWTPDAPPSRSAGVISLFLAVAVGCIGKQEPKDTLDARSATSWQTYDLQFSEPTRHSQLFEKMAPQVTGVSFLNHVDPRHPMRRLYHSGYVCGGVAIGDINADGRPDIFIVGGANRNALFLQVDDFKFRDITDESGVGGSDAWGTGATLADIDNDGDLDLYVCNYEVPNQLFENDAKGRFIENAKKWGLDLIDGCLMPSFCDYDRDGDLDAFVLTNHIYRDGGRPTTPPWQFNDGTPKVLPEFQRNYALTKVSNGKYGIEEYGRPDFLLRNDGGRFTNVSETAGIRGHGFGLSATWWDYNLDGWTDLYVCNDYNDPDRLYKNNGDGGFTDVLLEAIPHTPWFSMGSDFGDINNDGRFDFIAVDMSATTHFKQKTTMGVMNAARLEMVAGPPPQYMRNSVYVNSGTERFWEAAYLTGLADSDWSWSVKLADLDNDGWQDVYITNGMVRSFNDSDVAFDQSMLIGRTYWDIYQHLPERPERNLAFRNRGQLRFEDASHDWGLDQVGMSYAAAHGDLDRDGDLDLVVANQNEPVTIYRNHSAASQHRITVELKGRNSNRFGYGATVRIDTAAGCQIRQLIPTTGFLGSSEPIVHFGLGDQARIKRLAVLWPSGIEQVIEDLKADCRLAITEPDAAHRIIPNPKSAPKQSLARTVFAASGALGSIRHHERRHDDFAGQPLLPYKLSQLGPGMAWGDIDGDSDEDLFVGGAAGAVGVVYIRARDGSYSPTEQPTLANDSAHEDMGAVFFDADSDIDLDLFVVSGGVECESGSSLLQDRLYINDGTGKFACRDDSIPDESDSGSIVSAADFDRDGDLDLFVGGRVLPGQYPLSSSSHLLVNTGGKFHDSSAELAANLAESGLVTSALWSDADADGWIDLLLTHEWGPVKYFRNDHGRLVDSTEKSGLQSLLGWWNSIACGDFDQDQDIDYVVGNFGLNTKYHASPEHPAVIYYGDFERNGRMQIVEAEFEEGKLFPVRGRSCSSKAMPTLTRKFKTFKDFAVAELEQVYDDECLSNAKRFEVNTLESGILWNDGSGRFMFRALPRLAQVSPVFGIVAAELDGDGFPDIFLAQNFFTPQPETGRMDGGMGLLLRGMPGGEFAISSPADSGVVLPDDSRSAALADLNDDAIPDLVVATNDGPVRCFINQGQHPDRYIRVKLVGPVGNPHAVGSRVSVKLSNGKQQTAETSAGGGYLSQGVPRLAFGCPLDAKVQSVEVTWPSGEKQTVTSFDDDRNITVSHPSGTSLKR